MNGWDVVITIINHFPPVVTALLLTASVVAVFIGIVGFSRHGMDFIRHGFQQNVLGDLLDKLATKEELAKLATKEELAKLATKEEIKNLETRIGGMETKIEKLATKEEVAKLETNIEKLENKLETSIEKMENRIEKMENRIGGMETNIEKLDNRIGGMETKMGGVELELAAIKVNHFGHLKNFLTELTGILMDKGVFNNTEKARLDNQLRGM